jgi:SAM-dependent methyltransferase
MTDFLREHLNVWWLRPESALWDAIASHYVSRYDLISPVLDLGSGNGIFSFITAGGAFSPEYDWFANTRLEQQDIYDAGQQFQVEDLITRSPAYRIDCAYDSKAKLLNQALSLGFYDHGIVGDANKRFVFDDRSFRTVFSNILYWLNDIEAALAEIYRILQPGGYAILCLVDESLKKHCRSYQWKERGSELLRRLNAGRSEHTKWMITRDEIERLTRKIGFRIADHCYYLSPTALQIWDIGLRPLSRPLVRMADKLSRFDRMDIKQEWVETSYELLLPLFQDELKTQTSGGMQLICLERG